MKDSITLYNHFHNGDIFFSRPIINLLKNHFNIDFYHNQNIPLFLDIPEINEFKGIPQNFNYTDHFIKTIKKFDNVRNFYFFEKVGITTVRQ